MANFVLLVIKNLGRNKVRTGLTALAVIVLVMICALVTNVTERIRHMVEAEASKSKLLVEERWVIPSQVPLRYVPEIARIPGVDNWTTWNMYGGFLDASKRPDRFGLGLATRAENLPEMHQGMERLDPSYLEAFKRERTGCIVGASIMAAMGWRIGQEFTVQSTTHFGKDLRFKIVGASPKGAHAFNFFFRDDYYREGTGDKDVVHCLWLRVRDAPTGEKVAAKIQQDFESRQPALKVQTESAGAARLAEKGRVALNILRFVSLILMLDMVVILSNSISIATRERRTEMAVLKVLGFKPIAIMVMVIGEATLIGAVSGFIGAAIPWGISDLAARELLAPGPMTSFMSSFPVGWGTVPWGLLLGAGVGALGSFFPAWSAQGVKVSDVFAKIA